MHHLLTSYAHNDDPSLLQYDSYSVAFVMVSPPKTRSMLLIMATMAVIVIIIIQVQANAKLFMAVPSMAQPALEIVVIILAVIMATKLRMTTIIGRIRIPVDIIIAPGAVMKKRPKSWITSLTSMTKRTSRLLPSSSVVMRMRIMRRVRTTTKL